MRDLIFYGVTVLIWGTTWLGITFQLGVVDPMVSIAYRFALAAVILTLWCRIRGLNMRFSLKEHLYMFLQGSLLFALNYWLFYLATANMTSGLVAVVFSSMVMMNVINGALFLGSPVDYKVVLGGLIGLCGITLVFLPEVGAISLDGAEMRSILLCVVATFLASLGNIISMRNTRHGIPVVQGNSFGMSYAAALMLLISLISGKPFNFEASVAYIGSLAYLSMFGSVIAFGCYLTLISRIGADRAAYATLLFPIVALLVSTICEGYTWSVYALAGVAMILLGNLLIIKKPAPKSRPEEAAGQEA
jgi:drug/metabolite transporter (DMT)-like permease